MGADLPDMPLLLPAKAAAPLIGTSLKSLYRWVDLGIVPHAVILRVGARLLFKRAPLVAWATTATPQPQRRK